MCIGVLPEYILGKGIPEQELATSVGCHADAGD